MCLGGRSMGCFIENWRFELDSFPPTLIMPSSPTNGDRADNGCWTGSEFVTVKCLYTSPKICFCALFISWKIVTSLEIDRLTGWKPSFCWWFSGAPRWLPMIPVGSTWFQSKSIDSHTRQPRRIVTRTDKHHPIHRSSSRFQDPIANEDLTRNHGHGHHQLNEMTHFTPHYTHTSWVPQIP